MKYVEQDIMRIREISKEVRDRKRGISHARAEADLLMCAGELALLQSSHNHRNKIKQSSMYFEGNVKLVEKPDLATDIAEAIVGVVAEDSGRKRRTTRNK